MIFIRILLFFGAFLFSLTSLYGTISSTMGYFCFPRNEINLLCSERICKNEMVKTSSSFNYKTIFKSTLQNTTTSLTCNEDFEVFDSNIQASSYLVSRCIKFEHCGMTQKMRDSSVFILYSLLIFFTILFAILNLKYKDRLFLRVFKRFLKFFSIGFADHIRFCNEITGDPTYIKKEDNFILLNNLPNKGIKLHGLQIQSIENFNFGSKSISVLGNLVNFSDISKMVNLKVSLTLEQSDGLKKYLYLIRSDSKMVCVNETMNHHYNLQEVLIRMQRDDQTHLKMDRANNDFICLEINEVEVIGDVQALVSHSIFKLLKFSGIQEDLIFRLIKHNELFFGVFNFTAIYGILNKKTGHQQRPFSIGNAQWKLYTSDCKRILSGTKWGVFWIQKLHAETWAYKNSFYYEDIRDIYTKNTEVKVSQVEPGCSEAPLKLMDNNKTTPSNFENKIIFTTVLRNSDIIDIGIKKLFGDSLAANFKSDFMSVKESIDEALPGVFDSENKVLGSPKWNENLSYIEWFDFSLFIVKETLNELKKVKEFKESKKDKNLVEALRNRELFLSRVYPLINKDKALKKLKEEIQFSEHYLENLKTVKFHKSQDLKFIKIKDKFGLTSYCQSENLTKIKEIKGVMLFDDNEDFHTKTKKRELLKEIVIPREKIEEMICWQQNLGNYVSKKEKLEKLPYLNKSFCKRRIIDSSSLINLITKDNNLYKNKNKKAKNKGFSRRKRFHNMMKPEPIRRVYKSISYLSEIDLFIIKFIDWFKRPFSKKGFIDYQNGESSSSYNKIAKLIGKFNEEFMFREELQMIENFRQNYGMNKGLFDEIDNRNKGLEITEFLPYLRI